MHTPATSGPMWVVPAHTAVARTLVLGLTLVFEQRREGRAPRAAHRAAQGHLPFIRWCFIARSQSSRQDESQKRPRGIGASQLWHSPSAFGGGLRAASSSRRLFALWKLLSSICAARSASSMVFVGWLGRTIGSRATARNEAFPWSVIDRPQLVARSDRILTIRVAVASGVPATVDVDHQRGGVHQLVAGDDRAVI
jgi:hypothetical protein